MPRLLQRRTVLLPTFLGWLTLFALVSSFVLFWAFKGEAFLSQPKRLPAEVLAVEGWIGPEGANAAAAEFAHGGYQFIVATSGLSGDRWTKRRWSYAQETEEQLLRLGIPRDRVILAMPTNTDDRRTFESAQAVFRSLRERDIHPKAINVFTIGVHARRSRLVFAKVFWPITNVGVVPWFPVGYSSGPWWNSSDRAVDFMKETFGYFLEALLNSGRGFKSTHDIPPIHDRQN